MTDANANDANDATNEQLQLVERWIGYGYHAADAIDGWIEENAAADAGVDLERVKDFAAAAFARKRAAETRWPEDTDCDRLDRAFAALHEQGVCAVQWAGDTLDEGLASVGDQINADGVPQGRYTGYCFFHSQDMDHALDGEGLMLAFGPVDAETEADAVRIGRRVCEALQREGLRTEWDGTVEHRIAVPSLRWQRRTPD